MKIKLIKCIRYTDQATQWRIITETGEAYPYSKIFKDKSVEAWLERGHMIAHKVLENGMVETWTFID